MAGTTTDLERQLAELLEQERFEPSDDFKANALIRDLSVHEEAAKDPAAWWRAQAEALHGFPPPGGALNDENPPFYKWFEGGTTNASYNCLDRHVEAGLGDRVAFKWRGEEGETGDITYAWLLEQTQRAANALKSHGVEQGDVVGIFLPMIPEVVVAMLACARIGAPHNVVFGGFSAESVRERMEFSEAKALITVDGARRKGKTAPVKQTCDDVGMPVQTTFVVRHTGIDDCPMGEGDVWGDEALEAADATCEAAPLDAGHP